MYIFTHCKWCELPLLYLFFISFMRSTSTLSLFSSLHFLLLWKMFPAIPVDLLDSSFIVFFFNTTAVSHWGRINWKRRNTFTITHSMTILPEVHWHYSSGVPPTCSIPIPLELRVQVLCFPPPGLESNYRLPESLHKFSLLTLQQHINSS